MIKAILLLGALTIAASPAGTNIGGAGLLTRAANGTGTIVSGSDDWWVMFPGTAGETAIVKVADDAPANEYCPIAASLYGPDGTDQHLQSVLIDAGASVELAGRANGAGRYYVDVTPDGCASPVPYTLTLVSGGGGTPPAPVRRSVAAGASAADAWPPLRGHASYAQALGSASTRSPDWYVLYKKPDTAQATIRVQNTAAGCTLDFTLYGANGNGTSGAAVQSALVDGNAAATFTVPGKESRDPQGRYFMAVTSDDGCAADQPYSIEPEPAAQWRSPALKVPTTTLGTGTVHRAYSAAIGVSEGRRPYSFTARTALPPGLRLARATGVISGKPAKAGTYTFLVTVTDSAKPARKSVTGRFSITIRRG